jgi:hypothetical protein
MIGMFQGVPFVVSQHATKTVFHWPDKERSRRLIKKLTKLRGPQVTYEPAAYQMADGRMVMHPTIYARLLQQSDHAKGGAA